MQYLLLPKTVNNFKTALIIKQKLCLSPTENFDWKNLRGHDVNKNKQYERVTEKRAGDLWMKSIELLIKPKENKLQ